jgi:hypothetical protein
MKKNLFFFLILLSCNTQDFLLSSTYQHWVGGRPESGSGTNYRFHFIAPANDSSFKIQSIKAHRKILNFRVNPESFQKNDTIMVSAYKSKDAWNSDTICKIQYQINSRKFTIIPKDLKELERLLYP